MRNRARLAFPFLPLVASAAAHAQDAWPSRPVKLLIPFPAGGSTDAQARAVGQELSAMWKQPVVPENRPGAGGVVMTAAVAKAPPDGYTMGIAVSSHAINPTLRRNLPYDTLKDLAPVSEIGVQHIILVAHPSVPANNLKELLDLARREPSRLSYGSPGTGTAHHLVMELLKARTGVQITHVPYRGGAPAEQDVMGGQIPLLMDTYFAAEPALKAGKVKPICLFSPRRPASVPDVPVAAELVPGVFAQSSIGLITTGGTPEAVIARMSASVVQAIKRKEFADQLFAMGLDPVGSTAQEYDARIRADIAKWAPIIKASGAVAD